MGRMQQRIQPSILMHQILRGEILKVFEICDMNHQLSGAHDDNVSLT